MTDGKVVEKVADQLEVVSTQVEDAADAARRLSGEKLGFFFAGAGIGVAAGFAVGYFVLGKRLKTKYEKIADSEIAEMAEHYRQLKIGLEAEAAKRRPLEELVVERGYSQAGERYDEAERRAIDEVNARFPDNEGSVQEDTESGAPGGPAASKGFGPSLQDLGSNTGSPADAQESETSVRNVFEEDDEEWDYEIETRGRRPDVPYIIHVDEFRENDPPHEKMILTYYEEDDILARENSHVIEDMDEHVGLGNIGRWGHGSNDPNIVYVRNEEMAVDFEIIRDHGSFHDTAHTIRHSAMRRRPHE